MAEAATISLTAPESQRLRLRACWAAVAVGLALSAAKLAAWTGTGSVALLSSLVDSLVDVAASVVNLLAVWQAAVPADREHRFGHGKAEPLAALGQSAFLCGSAFLLLAEALRRLVEPSPIQNTEVAVAIMVFSILMTIALVTYQRHVVEATGSLAIGADELHYRGDLILSGSVIVVLLLSDIVSVPVIDPLFGIGVGVWVVCNAIKIGRLSFDQLMDRELPDAERARARAIAERHPEVSEVHDIRTRVAGPTVFIQMHIALDGDLSLSRAHAVALRIETELAEAFPGAEIIIHQDPVGVDEPVAFPAAAKAPPKP